MRILLLLCLLIAGGILHAEEAVLTKSPAVQSAVPGRILWRTSVAVLIAANAVDIHSSWGKHELNPALAGPTGNFGYEGTLIKVGLTSGLMGIEYLIMRRHPSARLHRAFAMINFGASSAVAGVAMHNYSVPRPR